jgi:hypothetical protein
MKNIGIPFGPVENDYGMNLQFSENGYESKLFLKNAGSSLFLLILYLSSWSIPLFIAMLSLVSTKMRKIKLIIHNQLIWK